MPIYEGISLIQEKQAVVLDLGSEYTKFGFTGEAAPRCIVRSEFWCPREKRVRRVYDYNTAEELYENLVQMLHILYFRHVLVNPKERRVVVVESLFTPTLFRETLAKVLYTHYEVSGVTWVEESVAACAALGVSTLLLVSLGAREVQLSVAVHGVPLPHAALSHRAGARRLHRELARLLDEQHGAELRLPDRVLEDVKVKTCFVGSLARALRRQGAAPPAEARGVRYPRGGAAGEALRVGGRARELCAEPLFARDAERASLPELVLRAAAAAPLDARRALLAAVCVCGGGAALPGLRARLLAELRALAPSADVRLLRAAAHDNCVAWQGGALLGAAEGAGGGGGGGGGAGGGGRAVTREQYARGRRLRDWCDLRDNTPTHLQHAL